MRLRKFAAGSTMPLLLSLLAAFSSAREIHVAENGEASAAGTADGPLLTIGAAAEAAMPGDVVVVHQGTYREWVQPVRGGTGPDRRIVYRAAPGEEVFIKGSERVSGWVSDGDGVWTVTLPNDFFGDYNPYALQLSGGWLNYGQWHHRGDVYLDGEALYEKETADQVDHAEGSWYCRVADGKTVIRANFGDANPNQSLTEINVRESLFMPAVTGLGYITVDGFHFQHAAANWAPPAIELQTGAVGPRMGKCWIIQNCTVTNARCVGIILGQAPGVDYEDIDAYGDHIVRNNRIRRCGQAGIAGQKGATRSLITGNLIEETNYRREFGGWETAAIKFHNSVDTVISNNLIRGVYHQQQGAFGIWMDFGNQGTRITRNIIYDTQAATVFLEMDHGPMLVDNNVLIGESVRSNSEATVFAHNLFVDCGYVYHPDVNRRSQFFEPHTTKPAGRKTGTAQDDRWYNNIFVRQGLDGVKDAQGYVADYNLYCEGSRQAGFEGSHSVTDEAAADVSIINQPDGVSIRFLGLDSAIHLQGPRVDATLVGVFPTVGQTIEDRDGDPISVDRDICGEPFARTMPGPLAELKVGPNTIMWKFGQSAEEAK